MKRILLVEDEPIIREPITLLLRQQGYEVTSAATEFQAIQLARAAVPDFVMLDITLADGGSGIEVCERLRALPRMERVPIMMLTADARRETVMRCVGAGANDYVLKVGFDLDGLLARIRKWIGGPEPGADPDPHGRW